MPVITLTTDLGTSDYYVGRLKGSILRTIPGATIVDISHDVEPFNIMQAAFILRNAYSAFPEGSIHLVGVNLFQQPDLVLLLIRKEGYFFLGADNGVFSLIWEEQKPDFICHVTALPEELQSLFPLESLGIRVIQAVLKGTVPEQIGTIIPSYRMNLIGKPVLHEQFIKGSVVYFDRFGNAMVNISRNEFDRMARGRSFHILFKRYSDVNSISRNYAGVDEGSLVVLFNSGGYLEIALNHGNARELLNLNTGDMVQIEFDG